MWRLILCCLKETMKINENCAFCLKISFESRSSDFKLDVTKLDCIAQRNDSRIILLIGTQ